MPNHKLYFYDLYPYFKDEVNNYEKDLGFQLPEQVYSSYEFSHSLTNWDKAAIEVFSGCKLDLSKINLFLEKSIKNMMPDLRLQLKNTDRNLHIEIYVTHKVDEKKKERLVDRNLCFLEINLSHYFKSNEDYTIEYVKNLLVNKRYLHTWLHFPKVEKFLKLNRKSIINEIFSRIRTVYREYIQLRDGKFKKNVWRLHFTPDYEQILFQQLKEDRCKDYFFLKYPKIFFIYVSIYKDSLEFKQILNRKIDVEEVEKNNFISRWEKRYITKVSIINMVVITRLKSMISNEVKI